MKGGSVIVDLPAGGQDRRGRSWTPEDAAMVFGDAKDTVNAIVTALKA